MNYGLLTLTFLSVNLDFFFMLIFLLKKYHLPSVIIGYLLGNILLLVLSYAMGRVLNVFLPEWVLGALGVLPIYLALHDDDDTAAVKQHRSEPLSVCVTYLSVCAGCNLSIFLPVLAGETPPHFVLALLFIAALTVLVVLLIKLIAAVPLVTQLMARFGERLMKLCYVLVGCYVFWDSGLISHLLGLM
ncbi:cadmium resistance transporter [Lacticaseibacillus zhaodongensis]|uniref:cadmium resistance transporter n=1 Tax=Lacticaseibacillus zhaodongensis TaxID=2668065 RepID=UPI0012D2AF99|nr:cadmium resistance transporter [Lacticaseibacillus zhaodongensis]